MDNPLVGWAGAATAVGGAAGAAVGAAAITAVGVGAGVGVAPPHAATVTARPISTRILNLDMNFSFLGNLCYVAEYNTNTIVEQTAPGALGCISRYGCAERNNGLRGSIYAIIPRITGPRGCERKMYVNSI